MAELVQKLSLLEALYHAANRYERDEQFRKGVPEPEWVANSLRESAERVEKMHDERFG